MPGLLWAFDLTCTMLNPAAPKEDRSEAEESLRPWLQVDAPPWASNRNVYTFLPSNVATFMCCKLTEGADDLDGLDEEDRNSPVQWLTDQHFNCQQQFHKHHYKTKKETVPCSGSGYWDRVKHAFVVEGNLALSALTVAIEEAKKDPDWEAPRQVE
ncbi:MAG: hypothetical protein LBJ92_00575 [Holosporales bacterium]|nr:hypothetical protein [Holosporales bacterium]